MSYDWEIARDLEGAIEENNFQELASCVRELEEKDSLNNKNLAMLKIIRDYADEMEKEGFKERAEDVIESQGPSHKYAKTVSTVFATVLASNTFYDVVFSQDIDPLSFQGGISEGLTTGIISAAGAYYVLDRFTDIDKQDYDLDTLDQDYEEILDSTANPELEDLDSKFYD